VIDCTILWFEWPWSLVGYLNYPLNIICYFWDNHINLVRGVLYMGEKEKRKESEHPSIVNE
jgi:hypothetical protein